MTWAASSSTSTLPPISVATDSHRVASEAPLASSEVICSCASAAACTLRAWRSSSARADSALRSAALNVYINVPMIKDPAFAESRKAEVEALLARGTAEAEKAYQITVSRL